MLQTYEGGCHCGRVRFRARADLALVSECNCSICTKKGILHITVAPENFELLRGEGEMTTYRFNTGTAQHTFCTTCGIHAFYVPRSDPDKYSVNARCLDDFNPATMEPRRLFDGRNWEAAYAERERSADRRGVIAIATSGSFLPGEGGCQEILRTGQFVVPAKAGTQEQATEIPRFPLSRE